MNITEDLFYFAFHNNKVESVFHEFLDQIIYCCLTGVHRFLGIRLLIEGPGRKKKCWVLRNPPWLLGTNSSEKHTNCGDDEMWEIRLATRLSLSLSSIFVGSRSVKSRLQDKVCIFWALISDQWQLSEELHYIVFQRTWISFEQKWPIFGIKRRWGQA